MLPGAFSIRCPCCLFLFFPLLLLVCQPCHHADLSSTSMKVIKLAIRASFSLYFLFCVAVCVCVDVAFSCPHHRDAHKWETGIGIPFKVLWVRESKPFVTKRLLRCYRCDDCFFFFFFFFSSEYRLELTAYWRDQSKWKNEQRWEELCFNTRDLICMPDLR